MPRRQREENNNKNNNNDNNGDAATNNNPLYGQSRPPLVIASNELFVKYYKEVNPIATTSDNTFSSNDELWESFVKYFETPLPSTFWINDTDPLAETFIKELQQVGGKYIEPIPWYPIKGCGWRVTASKEDFRKSPDVHPLRQLLIRLTALGVSNRQEVVSMLPPLLLEIKKNDKCLDCCAAPGSKTAQMLVALGREHQQHSNNLLPFDYVGSQGVVVANELDEKRSNMLVHQCKRIRSLFPFAVFCNHDARYFPNMVSSSSSSSDSNNNGEFFDKVLCDVMCSGDGTLRKAPALLRTWRPFEAASLQKSQIQVALRGAHLLKVGGRLVYSTCSLNPIENEAVVSQILLRTNGALKLIEPRSILPGLKCDPGMKTWKVMKNDGTIASEGPSSDPSSPLHPALFPVPDHDFPLERCMRLMPYHCEGGGFFIAVFEKVSPWTIVTAAELQQQRGEKNDNNTNNKEQEQKKANDNDDAAAVAAPPTEKATPLPLLPFNAPASDLLDKEIYESLAINESILPRSNLFCRAPVIPLPDSQQAQDQKAKEEKLKQQDKQATETAPIQLVSSGVRDLIAQGKRNPLLRISACGLRTFVPQPGYGGLLGWRISNEASSIVAAVTTKFLRADLSHVLPMINEESGSKLKDILFENIKDEDFKAKIEAMPVGCFLLKVITPHRPQTEDDRFAVFCPALRARSRIQLLVDAEDMQGVRCRLGIELAKDKSIENNKNNRRGGGNNNQNQEQE